MRYKKYKLGDVFSVESVSKLSIPGKNYIMDRDIIDKDGTVPYIAAISTNNGITGYSSKYDANNKGDCITLSTTADSSNTVFYQEDDFIGRQQIAGIRRKDKQYMGHYVGLYIVSIIKKITSSFNYSNKLTKDFLRNCTISLPVITKYIPDFERLDILIGGGTDMSSIDTSSWKEFKLGELFDIENTWIYGKNKQYKSQLKNPTNNSIAVVSGVTTNNGVNYYTEDILDDSEIYNDCLTISTRGEYSGSVFYHDYPFVLANNILVMPMSGLSKESKLFIATVIQALPFGGYGNYPTKDKLKESVIKLPVKESEEIDWDYMQERIAELEQYLIAAGLNDYELTDEDKEILATKLTDGRALQSSTSVNGCLKEARMFRVGDLFEKKTMKGYPKLKENLEPNETGYHVYGQNIMWQHPQKVVMDKMYLHKVNPDHPILAYTSSVGEIGMIDESFYRSGDNGAFQGLLPKWDNNRYEIQYILSVLKRHFAAFGYSTSMANIVDLAFILPIQTDSQNNPIIDSTHMYHPHGYIPDWEYMEKYIKATEKIVIRDVVDWKDEMIRKTKEVVEGVK